MTSQDLIDLFTEIFLYTIPVVIFFGIVGNIMAFIIFSRKKFENTIFTVYFRILTFSDNGTLIFAINRFLILRFGIRLRNYSDFLCVFIAYLFYIIPAVSGWFLVFISFDRLISIFKPSKFLFRKKITFQVIISVSLIAFNMIFYSQILFSHLEPYVLYNTNKTLNMTLYKCEIFNLNGNLDWMDLFNSTLIPFFLMVFFTSITLKLLYSSRKRLSNRKTHNRTRNNTNAQSESTTTRSRDVKFAITSVTLNFLFLVLNIPVCIFTLVRPFGNSRIEVLIDYLVSILYYINFGTLFYTNFIVNSIFRDEVITVFKNFFFKF